eukprot:COSAG01_NODE_20999_length_923_cov_0.981796_2_plen_65_part_00
MYTAVALLALVGTAFGAVPMLHQDAEEKIAHEFIVKFHDDIRCAPPQIGNPRVLAPAPAGLCFL